MGQDEGGPVERPGVFLFIQECTVLEVLRLVRGVPDLREDLDVRVAGGPAIEQRHQAVKGQLGADGEAFFWRCIKQPFLPINLIILLVNSYF